MGNLQDKVQSMGEAISQKATEATKLLKSLVAAPKKPTPMPDLGDGQSEDQLRTRAEIMYNMDTKTCINIGFIGQCQDSKLAMINAFRYVADFNPDTGIVSPKNVATQYIHADPAYKHVRFWNISDMGGSFTDRCLFAFDALLLVVGEVIHTRDLDLIKEAGGLQPPRCILIVRTGMDRYMDQHFGMEPSPKDVINGKNGQGPIIREGLKNQLTKCGCQCPTQCGHIYLVSPPGLLAARAVNFDGLKYIWDEFDLMKNVLECVSKHRY